MTQSEFVNEVVEMLNKGDHAKEYDIDYDKRDVNAVLEAMSDVIAKNVKKTEKDKKGNKKDVTVPVKGLFRVKLRRIPAKKKRKGIDPFTKEEKVFKAKPASKKFKVTADKKLRDKVGA